MGDEDLREQYPLRGKGADLVVRLDNDNDVSWVSPSVRDLLGVEPADLVGRATWWDLLHPLDVPSARSTLASLRAGAVVSATVEVRLRHADGAFSWWQATGWRADGDPSSADVVVALRDIGAEVRRRDASRRAEALLAAALDVMLDPLVLMEPVRASTGALVDLRYVEVNIAAAAYLGRTRDALTGALLSETTPVGPREKVLDACARVLDGAEPFILNDVPLVPGTAGGEARFFDIRAVAVEGLIEVLWRDVTDRVEAARSLAESEARYRLLAERATDLVFRASPDAVLDWVSPSATTVLARDPVGMVGHRLVEFVHPDDLSVIATARQAEADRSTVACRVRWRHGDGSWRWMDVAAEVLRQADGTITGRIGSARDITAQVEAEQALSESEELFRTAMESASIGVCLTAPDGGLLRVNPALCTLLGRDESTLLRTSWQEFTHPDDLAVDLGLVDEVLHGRRDAFRLRKRYLRPDGSIVYGDLSVGCVRNPDGSVRHFISQIVDVTAEHDQQRALEAERAMLEATLDSELDPHVAMDAVRDATGRIVDFTNAHANPAALAYLGMSLEELRATSLMGMYPSAAARTMRDMYAHTVDTGVPLVVDDYAYPNELWQGQERRYDLRGVRLGDGISLTWRDVTDRHAAVAALAESEARYRLLADHSSDVVMLADESMRVQWASPSTVAVLGRSPEELLGEGAVALVHPDDLPGVRRTVQEGYRSGTDPRVRFRWQLADGTYRWMESADTHFSDEATGKAGRVIHVRDIDAQVSVETTLQWQASTDALTGLVNRTEAIRGLEAALSRPPRTDREVAVLFCDLDDLKGINDGRGHDAGDLLVTTTAERIAAAVRRDDLVARFGGDEFLVLLSGVRGMDDAWAVAEKIRRTVASPIPVPGAPPVASTMSIGVTLAHPRDSVDRLIARADAAMYAAKRSGGDATATAPIDGA